MTPQSVHNVARRANRRLARWSNGNVCGLCYQWSRVRFAKQSFFSLAFLGPPLPSIPISFSKNKQTNNETYRKKVEHFVQAVPTKQNTQEVKRRRNKDVQILVQAILVRRQIRGR